jgi:hypothetical protein
MSQNKQLKLNFNSKPSKTKKKANKAKFQPKTTTQQNSHPMGWTYLGEGMYMNPEGDIFSD